MPEASAEVSRLAMWLATARLEELAAEPVAFAHAAGSVTMTRRVTYVTGTSPDAK